MEIPFVYGKIAEGQDFTDREDDGKKLLDNFHRLVNTVIISPRRWGKTSLVNRVLGKIRDEKDYLLCKIDIFNCRTEAQFFQSYANAILSASYTKIDEFLHAVKKYLSSFGPKISLSDIGAQFELGVGIDFRDNTYSYDEILDLPQKIAEERGVKFIVCIDEFQNVSSYHDSIGFQRKLRSHWQNHSQVGYCIFGSKRHMLLDIFSNYQMPFYKFGDIMFLDKISKENWIKYITNRFLSTGKIIADTTAGKIADYVDCHPYYVQQLAQISWLRTEKVCDDKIVDDAFSSLVSQLSLLFSNIADSLTARQIQFLRAIANGETMFSSATVIKNYDLGTSANVKNLKKALQDKDLIDIWAKEITIQDPLFAFWIKNVY
ncbi:MAG: ATP-binding protein [Muribaculaceae bacterium]